MPGTSLIIKSIPLLTDFFFVVQFVCIAQAHYFEVLAQGKENMDFIYSDDGTLEMVKEKREADGGRTSNIVIRVFHRCFLA